MFSETEMLLDLFLQECWKLLGVCSQEEESNSVVQKFNFWSRELEQKSVSSIRPIEVPGFREGKCKILQHTHFSHTLCYADYPVCRSYGEGTRNIGERAYCAILILRMSVCIDNSGFGLGVAVIFGSSKSVLVCSFWPDIGVTQPHFVLILFPCGNRHPMLSVKFSNKNQRGMLTWIESAGSLASWGPTLKCPEIYY